LRAAARRGWLVLAGAVALLAPLMAQPVSQAGPIDPDAQTLARPKPKPAVKGTSKQGPNAQGANKSPTAAAQTGTPQAGANAPAKGAAQQGASSQGTNAQGANKFPAVAAQSGNAPARGASAQGTATQGTSTQGTNTQGANKSPAAAAQPGKAAAGASQPSWSTQGGYKQGASTDGANAQGQKKAQAATAQTATVQTAAPQAGATTPAQGASALGANAQGSPQQGWSTQGQSKPQAPAAQIPLRPQADSAQQGEMETPIFRSDVQLVRMLATVRDHAGALAGGLKREEFQITDSGVPQELAVFEATTEQPLSVAILIDCSASTYREKRTELDSVRTFGRSLFGGGNAADAAALYSFNADITLEAGWTHSAERIERALGRLHSDGATALYDAITLSAHDLTGRGGRHVVIVVTDGGDTFSKANYQQALEAAHGADAILYAVVIVPVAEDPGRNTGGEHALVAMAGSTGGRAFLPGTQQELDDAFGEILRDLRTQYLLAYYPRGVAATRDRFHEVKLALTRPGYSVASRRGYFEPAPGKGFKVTPR
jgi:Ca-activated chloride channel family protein